MKAAPPLCVDLDGTLCRSDTLIEAFFALLRSRPWLALAAPFWLLAGRAAFKRRLAQASGLQAARLPWRQELVDWLRTERAAGRRLVLCTGADRSVARACARVHPELFHEVLASDGRTNLTGSTKRRALVLRFGERGYDYVGNERRDVAVWASAATAHVADATPALVAAAKAVAPLGRTFARRRRGPGIWLKALRAHQWLKNSLIFVPLLLARRVEPEVLLEGAIAMLAFCACASSVYLLNDLLDLEADRLHPRKRHRPFAAARLPLAAGLVLAPLLLALAFALAALVNTDFAVVLAGYYGLTLAYSLQLKRMPMVDVLTLAALYTLRIIAGGAAVDVTVSFWLLAFSTFLFLSLGIVKRYAEMDRVRASAGEKAAGRGYLVADLPLLLSLGTAAGYGAVVVLALYLNSPESLHAFPHPRRLWLIAPLVLYWISRVWLKTHRGQMHDDPIVFAIRDAPSRLVLGAALVVMVAAGLP